MEKIFEDDQKIIIGKFERIFGKFEIKNKNE